MNICARLERPAQTDCIVALSILNKHILLGDDYNTLSFTKEEIEELTVREFEPFLVGVNSNTAMTFLLNEPVYIDKYSEEQDKSGKKIEYYYVPTDSCQINFAALLSDGGCSVCQHVIELELENLDTGQMKPVRIEYEAGIEYSYKKCCKFQTELCGFYEPEYGEWTGIFKLKNCYLMHSSGVSKFMSYNELRDYAMNVLEALGITSYADYLNPYFLKTRVNQEECSVYYQGIDLQATSFVIFFPKGDLKEILEMPQKKQEFSGSMQKSEYKYASQATQYLGYLPESFQTISNQEELDYSIEQNCMFGLLGDEEILSEALKCYELSSDYLMPYDGIVMQFEGLKLQQDIERPKTKQSRGKREVDINYDKFTQNFIYFNTYCGIEMLLNKIEEIRIRNMEPITRDSNIITSILSEYYLNKTDMQTVNKAFQTLHSIITLLIDKDEQYNFNRPKVVVSLESSEPLSLDVEQIELDVKEVLPEILPQLQGEREQCPDELSSNIKQIFDNAVSEYEQGIKEKNASKAENKFEIRKEQKQQYYREMTLRGVIGERAEYLLNEEMDTPEDPMDLKRLAEFCEAEGYFDELEQALYPYLENESVNGFSNYASFRNHILNETIAEFASQQPQELLVAKNSLSLSSGTHNMAEFYYYDEVEECIELLLAGDQQFLEQTFSTMCSCFSGVSNLDELRNKYYSVEVEYLVEIMLEAGLALGTPLYCTNDLDIDRIFRYIEVPVSFIIQGLAQQHEDLISINSAVLSLCWIKTSAEVYPEEQNRGDRNVVDSNNSLSSIIASEYLAFPVVRESNQMGEWLLKKIFAEDDNYALYVLYNGLRCEKHEWQNSDGKTDISTRFKSNNYYQDDLLSIFENMGFPLPTRSKCSCYSLVTDEQVDIPAGEDGKRKFLSVEESAMKPLQINLEQAEHEVLISLLYELWEEGDISASTVSDSIFSSVGALYERHRDEFLQRFREQSELIALEEESSCHEGVDGSRTERLRQSKASQLQSNVGVILQKTQQAMRAAEVQLALREHQTPNELEAVEEHICNDDVIIQHLIPELSQFESEKEYMDYLLGFTVGKLSIPMSSSEETQSMYLNVCSVLSLAEFLQSRQEQLYAKQLALKASKMLNVFEGSEFKERQLARVHSIILKQMLANEEYENIVEYLCELQKSSAKVYNSLFSYPIFSLVRAEAYMNLSFKCRKDNIIINDREYSYLMLQNEVQQNAISSFISASKRRFLYDDFWLGSTNLAENSYANLEFAYSLLKCLFFSANVVDYLANNYSKHRILKHLNVNIPNLHVIKQRQNIEAPRTSTAFLAQKEKYDFLIDKQSSQKIEKEFRRKVNANSLNSSTFRDIINRQEEEEEWKQQINKIERSMTPTLESMTSKDFSFLEEQNSIKNFTKNAIYALEVSKFLLEEWPAFGPAWGMLAILELCTGNYEQANQSASLAIKLTPACINSWMSWTIVEFLRKAITNENISDIEELFFEISDEQKEETIFDDLWLSILNCIENK